MQRVDPMNKIVQRSIGFTFRHLLFFAEYPDFRPDEYCRKAIDEQINLIDIKF